MISNDISTRLPKAAGALPDPLGASAQAFEGVFAGQLAQTVKYADLIYNIGWVLRYQRKKVKGYLKRKLRLLKQLDKGDTTLQTLAIGTAHLAIKNLS